MTGSTGPAPSARNTHRLETRRLLVDLPVAMDADRIFSLTTGAEGREVTATLVWDGPRDHHEVEWWIEQCRTATYGEFGFHWVIRDATGGFSDRGAVLGAIGTRPTAESGHADVGYWLGKPYWGRGLMREALTAVLTLCFRALDHARVVAEVFTDNTPGRALVERVGMTLRDVIPAAHVKRGRPVDFAVYAIDRAEWERTRPSP